LGRLFRRGRASWSSTTTHPCWRRCARPSSKSSEQVIPEAIVAVATDGYEALVQVGAFRPDVLVLDIRMPRLDGFEVCRRLKAKKETASIRILAVTAHPEGQVRDQVMACGADGFREKPFAIEKFRSRVVGLLAKGLRA